MFSMGEGTNKFGNENNHKHYISHQSRHFCQYGPTLEPNHQPNWHSDQLKAEKIGFIMLHSEAV